MFYDYHTHTFFSDDSDAPMTLMLDAGIKNGLAEMAITDHYDPGYPDPEFPFKLDFDEYHRQLEEKQEEYRSRIRLVKGIEIGIQHDQLDNCRKAARAYDYDYIIGSFHCACAEPLYNGHFFDGKTARQVYEDYYTYVLNNLKKYDAVEVIACASRGLEKAQRKAAQHGIPKAYASGAEVIADPEVDLILNLTTPQAHYEYNLAALKDVYKRQLCSKPWYTGYTSQRCTRIAGFPKSAAP